MATRNFLLNEDLEEGRRRLLEGVRFPEGVGEARARFHSWLEERLLARLNEFGDFASVSPVLLGSWARRELCPRSDIDLLFIGPEDRVAEYLGSAFKSGLKLRARTPADLSDWSRGVEAFDILALHAARAFQPQDEAEVEQQRAHAPAHRAEIFRAIKREREDRRRRQDSISSYLEPNLKYGAGGLRDIEQALSLKPLFARVFQEVDDYPFRVLTEIKEQLLFLRALNHLCGSGDVLSAHDQLEMARSLEMESPHALMKFVQSQLERASFYADWVVAFCHSGPKSRASARQGLEDPEQCLKLLRDDPSQLRQFEVRRAVDRWKSLEAEEKGRLLEKALRSGDDTDAFLVALYRTRWLEILVPDLKKLRGLVQHDHYHRYTADAHLVQTLREVRRLRAQSRLFGVISRLSKDLTPTEWWTLKLTALFHDLAKGRKGDHSTEGAKLVDRYFEEWGFDESLRADVRFLVENHLLLSTAAFRQNPQAQTTWKRLFARGVEGRRLILLALFTAIDIRATNPEAWTPWKAQLLFNLVENLRSPEAQSLNAHLAYARKKGWKAAEDWLLEMDPQVLQILSPRVLLDDLRAAAESETDLPVKVITKDRRLWIRFHRKSDRPGLFMGFVHRLFGLGLSVTFSSVQTLPKVGVYDWFAVPTKKPARQIAKWLSADIETKPQMPAVQFQSIDLMSQDEGEWILSFKGRDQRGLLLAAAIALKDESLSLRWARAHTWGQQVEDIFSVRPFGEVEPLLSRLRARLVT